MTPSANELERLRDILYGEQVSKINERLAALEENLRAINEQINGQFNTLAALDVENKQSRDKQSEEMNRLASEQSQKLKEQSQGLTGQIQDLNGQIQGLMGQVDDLGKQIKEEEKQSQKRDDGLKKELAALISKLEDNKVARKDLGVALIKLGQSIQDDK